MDIPDSMGGVASVPPTGLCTALVNNTALSKSSSDLVVVVVLFFFKIELRNVDRLHRRPRRRLRRNVLLPLAPIKGLEGGDGIARRNRRWERKETERDETNQKEPPIDRQTVDGRWALFGLRFHGVLPCSQVSNTSERGFISQTRFFFKRPSESVPFYVGCGLGARSGHRC